MIATEDTAEILTQEGESGLETVGFSGATTLDIQKRRARPTSTLIVYNWTGTAAISGVYPLPVAYWGNFATLFDGTIVAGTRLDGQGVGFANFFIAATSCYADGTGGSIVVPPRPNYMPPSYTTNTAGLKGSNAGIDVFFQTSMTDVDVNVFYILPGGAIGGATVVNNKVPIIGNLVPGVITTRRRPEGYNPGEDGVQIFFRPPTATNAIPAGFVDPATVGVPQNGLVDAGFNRLQMDLTP